jgi:hypothetical protein
MQLTGPAFLLSVVESRWKPARQLILSVRRRREEGRRLWDDIDLHIAAMRLSTPVPGPHW